VTITYAPATLLTLEPIKDAIRDVLVADLPAALDIVQDRSTPFLHLAGIEAEHITLEVFNHIRQVAHWPSMTIAGWHVRPESASEQRLSGMWRGQIDVTVFVKDEESDRDALARRLDRYLAAIWLALGNTERYAGAEIDGDSQELNQSEPLGTTAAMRAGVLSFDVTFVA
jgi:hypothetical protein